MKKIENVLLLPALVLLVLIFVKRRSTLDLHLHDTYYVIANAAIVKWFLYWIIVQFILYTIIRRRHGPLSKKWAVTHISITVLLIGLILFLPHTQERAPVDYKTILERWQWYNEAMLAAMLAFLLSQIVFLIYFVIRLFQSPEPQ
jgi:hypothetical protein